MKKTILSILLFLFLVVPSGCMLKTGGWELISQLRSSLGIAGVNPVTGDVIVSELGENYVTYYQNAEEPIFRQVLYLDPQQKVTDVCFSDVVWSITLSGKILSSNLETGSWESHTEANYFENGIFIRCVVLSDNKVVFWRDNKLVLYSYPDQWTEILLPGNVKITSVAQDNLGLWVIDGFFHDVYRIENNIYRLIATDPIKGLSDLFVFSNGEIWLSDGNRVYEWNLDNMFQPSLIFEFSNERILPRKIFEDRQGIRWIVTTGDLWAYQAGELQKIEFPVSFVQSITDLYDSYRGEPVFRISDAAFDSQRDLLYLVTADSLYYIPTEEIKLK